MGRERLARGEAGATRSATEEQEPLAGGGDAPVRPQLTISLICIVGWMFV